MLAAVFMRVKRSLEKRSASRQIHRSLHATGTADALRFSWLRHSPLTFAAATLFAQRSKRCSYDANGDFSASLVTGLVEGAPRRYTEQNRHALRQYDGPSVHARTS